MSDMKSEKVLAAPAAKLWERVPYLERGLVMERAKESILDVVERHGVFMDRPVAEIDAAFKQIIPYAVVRHSGWYFLLRRKSAQSEQRLHDKFSIGVGGHINPSEASRAADIIHEGLNRELNEELDIAAEYTVRFVGLINDDTTDVGRVHIGLLYEIGAGSRAITVRETHKMDGAWAEIGMLEDRYPLLETWSQIVFDSYLQPRVKLTPENGAAHSDLRMAAFDQP